MTRPAGSLKKLVDAGKIPTRVLGSVERFVISQPKDTSRATDVIHPSAMVKKDWCHRAEYYHVLGHEPAPSKYAASMKQLLVFEEGHRIHNRWQNWLGEMGNLFGVWECNACQDTEWGLANEVCGVCWSVGATYKEVPVSSPDGLIRGHADGWLKGFGTDLLLEIKSVGEGTIRWEDPQFFKEHDNDFKKAWVNIRQPFPVHIAQAQVYMKLLELNPPVSGTTPQEAVFIYESKVDQQTKEFVIPKSDFGISHLFDAVDKIRNAISAGVAPMCNINPEGFCSKCEVFNGD